MDLTQRKSRGDEFLHSCCWESPRGDRGWGLSGGGCGPWGPPGRAPRPIPALPHRQHWSPPARDVAVPPVPSLRRTHRRGPSTARQCRGTHLADDIVAAQPVLVHDGDDDGRLAQPLRGDVEGEGLVEDGVEAPLHDHRLLLLHPLVLIHQPHLHVGVWGDRSCSQPRLGSGQRCPARQEPGLVPDVPPMSMALRLRALMMFTTMELAEGL